jgi:transposase
MRGRPIAPLVLSQQERAYLERQVRRHRVARSLSERCRAILRYADGLPSKYVAAELGFHEHTVGKWRRRFLKDRCDGLLDEARPGRPRTINDDQVAAVIERTLRTTPADATHWSIRSMAAETGFSHTTIRRMWVAFGLQPHRSQTFKLSSDPLFVDKVRDIVGLYLSPPNRALVLSIDEKSQIQALDREQPVLPMMAGVPERRTHSYVRHGTTTLFAALDVASGFIIGKCYKRHRAIEFLKFLKEKTAAGRLKSSQNAFRHGLSCPPRLDPGMSTKFEAIAHALRAIGENTEAATECAEALLDLARIRSVRAQITAAMESHEYGEVQKLRRLAALDRYERLAQTKCRRASHKLRQG